MTAITALASRHLASPGNRRPLLLDVLRSEWTKLRSVRSTYWTLLAVAATTIGLGVILSVFYISKLS